MAISIIGLLLDDLIFILVTKFPRLVPGGTGYHMWIHLRWAVTGLLKCLEISHKGHFRQ
jgi:hypothetical protein